MLGYAMEGILQAWRVDIFIVLFLLAMVELDGDDIRISSRGKLAERDIVQVTTLLTKATFKTNLFIYS